MNDENFYLDEKCVVSATFGELGWFLQRHQGRLRFLKQNDYKDYKFLLFCSPYLHVFVDDFIHATLDLPEWFYDLNLDRDGYESVKTNSLSGSFTDPIVYSRLLNYFRQFYNVEKAIELWPPRGCNPFYDNVPQMFCRYESTEKAIETDREIIVVFPRFRARASNRNVPQYVWFDLVNMLKEKFLVVLAGTPGGACLGEYEGENIVNLINYNKSDKTEKLIVYLNSAKCSISSQSGGSHISLFTGCPTYMIGHERERHSVAENRIATPVSFRTVGDYRAIDAYTIISDIEGFFTRLEIDSEDDIQEDIDIDEVIKSDEVVLENILIDQKS